MNVYMHRPDAPILVLHTEAISRLDDGWQYQTDDEAMHTLPADHSLLAISGAATVTYTSPNDNTPHKVYVVEMELDFEAELWNVDYHAYHLDGYINIFSVIAPSYEP